MSDTIYVYENHKITGPDGYNVDIIISDHGKEITIEGTDNIQLKREKGKYIISHNFLEEGSLKKSSGMEYKGNNLYIPKKYVKDLSAKKLDFAIYSQNIEVAYINKYKNSLNINVEQKEYVIPVIIYIAVLSRRLKERFGHLYMKTGALPLGVVFVYSLLAISSVLGVGINSFTLSIVSVCSMIGFSIIPLVIQKKDIF